MVVHFKLLAQLAFFATAEADNDDSIMRNAYASTSRKNLVNKRITKASAWSWPPIGSCRYLFVARTTCRRLACLLLVAVFVVNHGRTTSRNGQASHCHHRRRQKSIANQKCGRRVQSAKSRIIRPRFDVRSASLTHRIAANIFISSGAAFRLASPIGGLFVQRLFPFRFLLRY